MKNKIYCAKFDWFVLKPLWVMFIIIAIYYFAQKAWVIGILMLGMNFLLGMIAASFHNEKTFHELARGYPTREEVSKDVDVELTHEESYIIGKAIVRLMPLFFIALSILAFHHGLKWYYVFSVSLLVGWLGPLIIGIPFFLFLRRRATSRKRLDKLKESLKPILKKKLKAKLIRDKYKNTNTVC